MTSQDDSGDGSVSLQAQESIDRICLEAENKWRSGQRPEVEELLSSEDVSIQPVLLRELLRLELHYRLGAGESMKFSEYVARFPQHSQVVRDAFSYIQRQQSHFSTQKRKGQTPSASGRRSEAKKLSAGEKIGRFRVERLLGSGGFADVYLGHDELLHRPVAIKVPSVQPFESTGDVDRYLEEARTVANLKHTGIVALFDARKTATGTFVLVMEYIDGCSLADRLANGRLSQQDTIQIVTQIADAAHHAHQQGFVHRDLNPNNVLIDSSGKPHIADFGLALNEKLQRNRAGEFAGTLPYMSPEQIRGETHRCDGRADIWAIGVILYEMLTGRKPFGGSDEEQLRDEILNREPKPPRQIDATVPAGLEEICLKCLAKAVRDRFTTAKDVADAMGAVGQTLLNESRSSAMEHSENPSKLRATRSAAKSIVVALASLAVMLAAIAAFFRFTQQTQTVTASLTDSNMQEPPHTEPFKAAVQQEPIVKDKPPAIVSDVMEPAITSPTITSKASTPTVPEKPAAAVSDDKVRTDTDPSIASQRPRSIVPVKPLFIDFTKLKVGELPADWNANGDIAVQSRTNHGGGKLPGLGVSQGGGAASADFAYPMDGDFFMQLELFAHRAGGIEVRLLSIEGDDILMKFSPGNGGPPVGMTRVAFSLNAFEGASPVPVQPFGSAHTVRMERRGEQYQLFSVNDKGNDILVARIPNSAPFRGVRITLDGFAGYEGTVGRIYSFKVGPLSDHKR